MFKRPIKCLYSAICALFLSAASAGPPDVTSGEFFNQPYLQGISIVPAWEAGLLGSGIVVANLDSGVRASHVDLVGTIAPGGYDFVNDDDDPFDDEISLTYGHGTASSGIIVGNWNGVGVGGIAPGAKILPIKITNEDNQTDGGLISQGMLYAATRPEVRIILLEAVGPSTSADEFAAFSQAIANGKLLIAPAGNKGQAFPSNPASQFSALGGAALVVGSHNGAGGKSVFSNGAAGVESNYLSAPGQDVVAAGNQDDEFFYRVDGTSMAAPQVAAAAALIWAYSPGLTASQVADILKKSATDLGSPGIDSVFGSGALNIEKALAPIGVISAPTEDETEVDPESTDDPEDGEDSEAIDDEGSGGGNSSSSGSGGGGGAGLALGALVVGGVGYALVRNTPELGETLVLDEYGRTYELDLETRVSVRNPGPTAQSVLKELDTEQVQETLIQRSDFSLATTYSFNRTSHLSSELTHADAGLVDTPVRMRMIGSHADGVRYAFGVNQRVGLSFDEASSMESRATPVMSFRSDAFASPLNGFSDLGYHAAVGFAAESGWESGVSFAAVDDQKTYGVNSESSQLQLGFRGRDFGVGVKLGLLEEHGNLLGGASDGALSVSGAQTIFGEVRGTLSFGNTWSLVGQYTHGITWAKNGPNTLVSDFSDIESMSWGLGLLARDLLSSGDAFGLAFSQPLRTIDGDARVSVPYWNYKTGGIKFHARRTSLVPDGKETSWELFYRKPLSSRLRLISYLIYREQPLHVAGSRSEASVASALSWSFGLR